MSVPRGVALAAAVGAAVLFLAGCGEPATPKGKDSGTPGSAPTPTGSGPSVPGPIGKTSAEAEPPPPKGSSPAETPVPSADPGHPEPKRPKQPKSSPTPAPGPRDVS